MSGKPNAMRVLLKGVHTVRKHLADGTTATYHYAWRGGPRLEGKPGSPEFLISFNRAHETYKRPPQGCLFTLVSEYKASAEYLGLAPTTQRAYSAYLKVIEIEFGDMPLGALENPKVRGEFKQWRDGMAATPRKADYAWTTLARVLSFAKDRGRIPVNPCERGGRLYASNRADKIWGEADIARVLKFASRELELALVLALWTGQRQGDLLALPWSAYDGSHIRLRQSKTGQAVVVRVGAALKKLLNRTKKRSTLILTNTRGRPWTSDGFRTSWGKLLAKAEIEGLTFHDLRGSAITRLSLAGATPQEIAGVTGHSLADVHTMLDRHYLGARSELGDAAIRRLERKQKRTKSVNRAVNRTTRVIRK
jgi:integrase